MGMFSIAVAFVGACTAFLNGAFVGSAQSAVETTAAEGMAAGGTSIVILVPDQHPTIQSAIDAVPDGGTVVVAAGLYLERLILDGRSVHLLAAGGGSAVQVVSGEADRPVVSIRGGRNRIEGFAFEGGRGEGGRGAVVRGGEQIFTGCRFTSNAGGAEVIDAQVDFDGCDFVGNRSSFAGGALLVRRGDVQLDRCRVDSNVATTFGGGIAVLEGEVVLQDTRVLGNRVSSGAWGGGLYGESTRLLVQGGTFEGNVSAESGPAAFLASGSGTFRQVRFQDNRSEGGWIVHGGESASLSMQDIEGDAGRIWVEERDDAVALAMPTDLPH